VNRVSWTAVSNWKNGLCERLVTYNAMKVLPTPITHPATFYRTRAPPVTKKEDTKEKSQNTNERFGDQIPIDTDREG